jgi:hypothetical protein
MIVTLLRAFFGIAFGTALTLGGTAYAQTLTLNNVGFSERRLTVFAHLSGTEDVSDCTFKIRGSAKRSDLTSSGLGTLLYTFREIDYAHFPVAGGAGTGFSTNELSVRTASKVYFRAYLACKAFALRSEIQSLSSPPTAGMRKGTVGKFLSHVRNNIDSGV